MFSIFGKRRIYLDHASATPVLGEAARATARIAELFGNPGATHQEAVAAKQSLQESRERIAHELGCKAREIIFTSGLTEANSLAILGRARALAMQKQGSTLHTTLHSTHWIVSAIEHDSVLEAFSEVERQGGKVAHIDPDGRGIISAEAITRALRPETVLVSIGWGNNEIGVIQPLKEIAHAIHAHEKKSGTTILFHSDAGQAPLYQSPQVHTLGVDLFSLSSGKLYGPRGIGCLYLSNRVEGTSRIAPIMLGGGQERGLRAGTEDVALATGFAKAFGIISKERESESRRLGKMRDDFAREIVARIPDVIVNGHLAHALPHMLNISLLNINAEYFTLVLDRAGIAVSTKSACNEGQKSSHVVAALGGPEWRAQNTLRFSLGRSTTEQELGKVVGSLQETIRSSK